MCTYVHAHTSYTWILRLLHNHPRLSGEVCKWMVPFVLLVSTCPGVPTNKAHATFDLYTEHNYNNYVYIYYIYMLYYNYGYASVQKQWYLQMPINEPINELSIIWCGNELSFYIQLIYRTMESRSIQLKPELSNLIKLHYSSTFGPGSDVQLNVNEHLGSYIRMYVCANSTPEDAWDISPSCTYQSNFINDDLCTLVIAHLYSSMEREL